MPAPETTYLICLAAEGTFGVTRNSLVQGSSAEDAMSSYSSQSATSGTINIPSTASYSNGNGETTGSWKSVSVTLGTSPTLTNGSLYIYGELLSSSNSGFKLASFMCANITSGNTSLTQGSGAATLTQTPAGNTNDPMYVGSSSEGYPFSLKLDIPSTMTFPSSFSINFSITKPKGYNGKIKIKSAEFVANSSG